MEGYHPVPDRDVSNIHLYWKNLSYKTKQGKVLVNNLNGHLQSGFLTVVLGPSGSGKTTMFECLAKRRIAGVSGQIWVSSPTSDIKRVQISYNPQKDCHFGVLTIRESLLYAYQLHKYCGLGMDILQHASTSESLDNEGTLVTNDTSWVDEIIQQLGLTQCSNVKVANCSGGQKKRLSIALELVFSPNVLLLDEPTTGLDSVSSFSLIQLLKSLVQSHPIIICASIHQPSARLFSLFDQVYVISSQGNAIYSGSGSSLLDHLNGFNLSCPIFHNIADFALEAASGLHGEQVCYEMAKLESNKAIVDENKFRVSINVDRGLSKEMAYDSILSSWTLFKRSTLISLREPFNYGLRALGLIMIMCVRLVLRNRSTLVDNECFNSTRFAHKMMEMSSDANNYRITAFLSRDIILLITSIMFTVIISLIPSLMLFPLELSVFIKEHSNKWYTRWSYYVAKSASDIPPTLAFPLIYAMFTYFLIEIPDEPWRLAMYLLVIITTSLLAHSFSMVISVIFINNTIAALITGAMLFVPFFIFSGFLIPLNKLPGYVKPFSYLSIYKLAIESVLIIFYGFSRCDNGDNALKLSDFAGYFGTSIYNISSCIQSTTSLPSFQSILNGYNRNIKKIEQSIVLTRFGLTNMDLFINVGMIISYIIILRIMAYVILKYKSITK